MSYPVAQPGVSRKNFVRATLSGNQNSNLAVGNHIEFDTIVGQIPMQTGAGQADGIFELSAGRTYRLSTNLVAAFSAAAGQVNFVWYDRTNGANLTDPSNAFSMGSVGGENSTPINEVVVTPTTDIEVEVRFTFNASFSQVRSASSAYVEEIEAFIPAVDSAKNFSLGEVDTGSRWIDGKTIYRRVFESPAAVGPRTVSTGWGTGYVDTIIGSSFVLSDGSRDYTFYDSASVSSGVALYFERSTGDFVVDNSPGWDTYDATFFVQYTRV